MVCSECWDDTKDDANDYEHLPYKHAKQCAEAYARYNDGDEAAEFRLSVRTAVIVDGAPLEESVLVAAAQKLFKRFPKELHPGFSKCGQGVTDESDGSDYEDYEDEYAAQDADDTDADGTDNSDGSYAEWCQIYVAKKAADLAEGIYAASATAASARHVGRWKSHDCSMDYSQ